MVRSRYGIAGRGAGLALVLVAAVTGGPRPGWAHPHQTPAQMRARINEIDALLPVVKRDRLELRLERAVLNGRLNRLAAALLDCRRAAFRFPESPRPHALAGELLELRSAYAHAARAYQEAIRLGDVADTTYWRLGNCLRELGRFAAAEAMFRKSAAAARDPLARAKRFVDVAVAAESRGDRQAAEEALTESVRLSDRWPAYLQARAELRSRRQDSRGAVADYSAILATAHDPEEEFPILVSRGDALARAGDAAAARADWRKAEAVITRLLAEDPAFVEDMYYWRGRARLQLGKGREAQADAEEALRGLPDQLEYLELMGSIGRRFGANPTTRKWAAALARVRAFEARTRKKFLAVQAEAVRAVDAALREATREAVFEAALETGLARLAMDPAAGRKHLALAARQLEALAKDYPDRAQLYAFQRARLELALGQARPAFERIDACVAKAKQDARFRRLRMRAARALSRTEIAERDQAFLDDLIKNSLDAGLVVAGQAGGAPKRVKK